MFKQMKKTLGILLAVCFLMSVTAAAASAHSYCGPAVVKEKKTAIIILKDVKTKIFKHHHHGKFFKHHHKNTAMNGRKGKDMAMKKGIDKDMAMKKGIDKGMAMKTGIDKDMTMKTGIDKDMAMNN